MYSRYILPDIHSLIKHGRAADTWTGAKVSSPHAYRRLAALEIYVPPSVPLYGRINADRKSVSVRHDAIRERPEGVEVGRYVHIKLDNGVSRPVLAIPIYSYCKVSILIACTISFQSNPGIGAVQTFRWARDRLLT